MNASPKPTVIVSEGRNYEAAFLMALCVSAGAGVLAKPAELLPNFERAMPPWVVTAWGVALLIGGGIALIGTLLRPGALSLLIWRVGLLPLAGASLAYPVALILAGGVAAAERSVTTLAFSVAVLARLVRITQTIRAGIGDRGQR